MKLIIIICIQIYRYSLSFFIGRSCRFSPSCSEYTIEAIKKYGVIKGGVLGIRRVGRCRPNGGSGYDPVP